MKLLEVIVKRAVAVIAIWLILIALSAPAFFEIDKLTEYRAERLLPEGAESINAIRYVYNISGSRGFISLVYHVITVKGVNATDPKLLDIDKELEESLKNYVDFYSSPYSIARGYVEAVERRVYNNTLTIFNYLHTVYRGLELLSAYKDQVLQTLRNTRLYLLLLNQYFISMHRNSGLVYELSRVLYTRVMDIVSKQSGLPRPIAEDQIPEELVEEIALELDRHIPITLYLRNLGVNITSITNTVAQHIAYLALNSVLNQTYVYRLVVGYPLVAITLIATGDSSLIDRVLYEAPVVNAIISSRSETEISNAVVDTVDYIFRLCIASLEYRARIPIALNISTISIKPLIEELAALPTNASDLEIIDAITSSLEQIAWDNISALPINLSDIRLALIGVLIEDLDPLDVVVNISVKYIWGSFSQELVARYLRDALREGDPDILYSSVVSYIRTDVIRGVIEAMKGRMVSNSYTSFMIVVNPIGVSVDERASNAYRAVGIVKEVLARHGYDSAEVHVIGDDVLGVEIRDSMSRDLNNINRLSMIATVIVALAIIGGLLATSLPFLGIASSLAVTHGLLYLLASLNLITITSWSRMLMITTAFGLGMNYSSYIILRFKEVYPEIRDPAKAAYESVRYALPAIAASASTDIIGFAVMKLAWEFPLIASIGDCVPFAIAVVLVISLTFTPALLAILGDKKWFWWPHRLESGGKMWRGYRVDKQRALTLVALSVAILAIGATGFSLYRGSHDYTVFIPEGTEAYKAYMDLQREFPSGRLMPIYVVCLLRNGYSVYSSDVVDGLNHTTYRLLGIDGISEVRGPTNPGDKPREAYIGNDNRSFYLEVLLRPSPLSREGIEITKEIRRTAKEVMSTYCREVLVGGFSASSVEMEEMLNSIFWNKVFPVAFILMWISMALSFNSLLSGFIALSNIAIGYFFGVAMVTLITGLSSQPMLWFLPLLTLPAVLGVGIDYNSYFMNRQRYELMNGKDKYEATSAAIAAVSHLVLGLGLIVTATYAALVIGSSWGIKEIGIALSTAVFTTTLMAAFVQTPAILALAGRKAWWPGSKRWRH